MQRRQQPTDITLSSLAPPLDLDVDWIAKLVFSFFLNVSQKVKIEQKCEQLSVTNVAPLDRPFSCFSEPVSGQRKTPRRTRRVNCQRHRLTFSFVAAAAVVAEPGGVWIGILEKSEKSSIGEFYWNM